MGEFKERRERLPFNQKVRLSTGKGEVAAQGVNISESGLLCLADQEVQPGTRVTFKMEIPGAKSSMVVDCEGNVIKCALKDGKFNIVVDFTEDALM